MNEDTPVGQRIRYWRKRRKLSQATLAGLVGRSVSWIEKVERGDRLVERVPVIIALAAALRIDPARLLGPPFELKENGAAGEPPRGVPALRRILLVPDALPPHRHPTTIDLQALNTTLERARLARYHGRYTEFGLLLPDLIADARTAVHHPDPEQARFAWAILAGAYQLAAKLCARLRENDLAWIAADRSASAAHRAGDPALVGQAVARLAHAVLVAGNSEACATVAEQGALALGKDLNAPSRIATWGHLQLVGMIAAARLDDAATERALLRRAWDAAERLPQGYVEPWTAFCGGNVAFHEISAAYDSGDPLKALRVAEDVELDWLPWRQRQARTLIDVARSHNLRRDDPATVKALLQAERISGEELRYHITVREVVRVMLRREQRSLTPGLRGLAERMGVE